MLNLKVLIILTQIVLYLNCRNEEKARIEIKLSYNLSKKEIDYTAFISNDLENIYLAKKYQVYSGLKDSIILEAIYKPSGVLDYNCFMPPEMEKLKPNFIMEGMVSNARINYNGQTKYLVRIFYKDFDSYLMENKISVPIEDDFIKFENQYSVLINAKFVN